MVELLEKIKTYLLFSKEEGLDLLISISVITLIFYFGKSVELDLISAFLAVTISLIFHIVAQKIAALSLGYKVEYKIWWYGILFSIMRSEEHTSELQSH